MVPLGRRPICECSLTAPRAAGARCAFTSPSTTGAGSPRPSCCPTRRRSLPARSWGRCLELFRGPSVEAERVMTDNGLVYRLGDFKAMLEGLGVRCKQARPRNPRHNGKVERMNWTLTREWQYARVAGALQLEAPARCVQGPAADFTHRW